MCSCVYVINFDISHLVSIYLFFVNFYFVLQEAVRLDADPKSPYFSFF